MGSQIFEGASRDQPGPKHEPQLLTTGIEGVILMKSPSVEYLGDNLLTEIYRPEWQGVFGAGEPVDHLYSVKAPSGGERREWYYHERTIDRYLILSGTLEMGLYDGRENSETHGVFEVASLGEPGVALPNAIRIPPLVWHSFRWTSTSGMFMVAKLPGYKQDSPDKIRIQLQDLPDSIQWSY